jgi:uncharacterized secreted protein with C-terminal beta-propeller domain
MHKTRQARPKARFQPRIESLEQRCLLDATPIAAVQPPHFASAEEFRQYLVNTALEQYKDLFGQHFSGYYYTPGPVIFREGGPLVASFASTVTAAGPADSMSISQTNVQVAGVDEGDLVKTDGTYLYTINGEELNIVRAVPASGLSVVAHVHLGGQAVAEYLDGNRLTVIDTVYDGIVTPFQQTADGFSLYFRNSAKVELAVFDVSDPTAPREVQSTVMDGSYINSRAVGDHVYLAVQNYLSGLPAPAYTNFNGETIYETRESYLARIAGHELDLALPHYYVRTGGPTGPLQATGFVTDPANLYKGESDDDRELLSLVSFDVTAATGPVGSASVQGAYGSVIYASPTHFYVVAPEWSSDGGSSRIFQFQLGGDQVSLTATGEVAGQVLNQFSLDENGSFLRVATTVNWGAAAKNAVYVLEAKDGTLDIVGRLEGLAPGEAIRSVRFLDDRAFVVTFQRVDPLLAIDLSDPTAPRLAGELQLPGFSSYLQPLDATHLLGIGRDSGSWGSNLKLALFDVSDLGNMREVADYAINPQNFTWYWGSSSEAEYDHHALSYFPETGTLAVPVYGSYTGVFYPGLTAPYQYTSSLWVFHVDLQSGFQLLGQVTHDSQVRRSLRIGDTLYSVAEASVQAHPLTDPTAPGSEVRLVSDDHYLGLLYVDLLHRPIDSTGTAAWDAALRQGATRADLVAGIQNSQEFQTNTIQGLYQQLLGRQAEDGGVKAWLAYLADGHTAEDLRAQILGSDEYAQQHGGNNDGFLKALYQQDLHRDLDAVGAQAWGQALAGGTSRAEVAAQVAHSIEAETLAVQGLYDTYLHRPADAAGQAAFVEAMQAGESPDWVRGLILTSPEYMARS